MINKDDNDGYYQIVIAPTFKNHCVGIETNGKLKVEVKYKGKVF